MAKDLTKLYSRPGAEAYHVFEDDNGQVQVKLGDRTVVTAVPSNTGLERLGERGATLLSPAIQVQSGLVGRRWAFIGESHTDGTGLVILRTPTSTKR